MTHHDRVRRTKALLAKAADNLGLNVTVKEQDTDSEDVPTVVLMQDGRVAYSIEVPQQELGTYTIGVSGGHGPGAWYYDIGIADRMTTAIKKLLMERTKNDVDGALQSARQWLDRMDAKGQEVGT